MEHMLGYTQELIASWGIHSLFWQLMILGALVTLPIGPWSIVALSQTQKHGTAHGMKIAISATFGDIVIATIAVIFFNRIHGVIQNNIEMVYTFTAVLLLLFGLTFLFSRKKKTQSVSLKGALHQWLDKIGFAQKTVDMFASKILIHKKFLYVFTFIWSSLHPGNILTYILLCVVLQGLGNNMNEISIITDFSLPLMLITAIMWCGWIAVGKYLIKFISVIKRCFGVMFVIIGLQLLFTYTI